MFLSENKQFLNISISHVSVVTHLRCGGMFHNDLIANLPLSLSVKDLKIGQHLAKLQTKV